MKQNNPLVQRRLSFRTPLLRWGGALFLLISTQVIHAEEPPQRHVISQAAMECMNSGEYPAEAVRAEATGVTVIRVHVDEEGVVTGADVVKSSGFIGDFDEMIAAHALAMGAVLVTDNERHFARVAGLTVVNWLRDGGGQPS